MNPYSCGIYGSASGSSGTGFTTVVNNYSMLPSAASAPNQFYYVLNSQGTEWLPGSLGGTYYPNGTYYSTGTTWITGVSPYQATQAAVNAGIITDQFVSPSTLANWSGLGAYVPYTGATSNVNLGTFTLTTPQIIGGSGITSKITYTGTTNATPTSTAIAHDWYGGNNGLTLLASLNNEANFTIAAGTSTIQLRQQVSSPNLASIYLLSTTASTTNYFANGTGTANRVNGGASLELQVAGATKATLYSTGISMGTFTKTAGNYLNIRSTSLAPLQLEYDSSNYVSMAVGSTGVITFDAVGTGASFVFSDGISLPYVAKTANYTITSSDYTVDCTANSFTVTLPTAVGITGRIYNIINSGAGTITIATTSSQTIGNISPTTTFTLYSGEVLNVQSNGANWKLYS